MAFVKGRAEDSAVLEIGILSSDLYALTTIGCSASSISGTYHLHDIASSTSGSFIFLNADIILDKPSKNVKPGFSGNYTCSIHNNSTVNFTVPENVDALISRLTNYVGCAVKKGIGNLEIVLDTRPAAGSVKVKEGKLSFVRHENISSLSELPLDSLEIANGAEFSIDGFSLNVKSITLEEGAKLSGTGTVHVSSTSFNSIPKDIVISPTVNLVFSKQGESGNVVLTDPQSAVPGHPAFWVDASKSESIVYNTLNGTNFVTRWNDCRQGEPMFATNIVASPQFINGEAMTNKYVRIGNHNDITSLKQSEMLVWNEPLYDVKAVFLVQDPSEGGGELLGRCSWRLPDSYYGSRGGPYYRDNSININAMIYLHSTYSTPSVRYGTCYVNGEDVSHSPYYKGSFMQLIEHHVNTNYASGKKVHSLAVDAFGSGYTDTTDNNYNYIRRNNGGMRIAECIVYTNTLTYLERVQVAKYLMSKWLGRKVGYYHIANPAQYDSLEISPENTISIDIASGTNIVKDISGGGTLTKTGEGVVLINNIDGTKLDVQQGDILINSLVSDSTALLNQMKNWVGFTPWLYVDAAKLSSLHTSEGSDGNIDVKRWDDISGNNVRLEMLYSTSTNYPHLRMNALNSLPMIDFGTRTTSKPAQKDIPLLVYIKADGTRYNRTTGGIESPILRTSFFVANSSGGGNSLLGADGNGYPYNGFPNYEKGAPILSVPENYKKEFNNSFSSANKWTFRKNGISFDPRTTPFSLGDDLFFFHSEKGGRTGITFGGAWGYDQNVGGLKYGEILLYQENLPSNACAYIEAYMQKKWFNRKTDGIALATLPSLSVTAGSTVTVIHGNEICVGSLSGGGKVVAEKITLADNAVFNLTLKENSTADTLVVKGNLALPKNCTLKVTGALDNTTEGVFTVLTADSITGEDIEWTIDAPQKPLRSYHVTKSDNAIRVSINMVATILILK